MIVRDQDVPSFELGCNCLNFFGKKLGKNKYQLDADS